MLTPYHAPLPVVVKADHDRERSGRFPVLLTHLLAQAVALVRDPDEAEDLIWETISTAWRTGTETGECLLPWFAGPAPGWVSHEAMAELALRRMTIMAWLRRSGAGTPPAIGIGDTATRPMAPPVWSLPPVPAPLAQTQALAAALVRAGAPLRPVAVTPGAGAKKHRRRHQRHGQAGGDAGQQAAAVARHDRLQAQLRERARAAERAGRRLDQARRDYDRARTAEERTAADAILVAAAVRHERVLAVRRDLQRQLAALLAAPDLVRVLACRERRG